MNRSTFGVIGLGTMGRNLAMNVESHGFPVAVWNREQEWTTDFIAANQGRGFTGTSSTDELISALERPRRILMMIPAGKPVDEMMARLAPRLEPGDILIDGGNSWFEDTQRRERELREKNIQFVGCGISGGEKGAREGPSMMPGGSTDAWGQLREIFEAIAAKTDAGPCVTHVGPDGAGHFVKMVHNGIEYADMQLIAESWDVMRRGLEMTAAQTADVFDSWNEGRLGSFLMELTAQVCRVQDPETGQALVDVILDKAGQKGTGKWTAQVALDLAVPHATIAAAIEARVMSSLKDERVAASRALVASWTSEVDPSNDHIGMLGDALYASRICAYAQGMALIAAASRAYNWNVPLAEIARIWKGGCIIRARLLDPIRAAFTRDPQLPNLLLDPELGQAALGCHSGWTLSLGTASGLSIPMPAHAASQAYFASYRSARLPQNLTQAQRDAFGAHTYERIDRPGSQHSEW